MSHHDKALEAAIDAAHVAQQTADNTAASLESVLKVADEQAKMLGAILESVEGLADRVGAIETTWDEPDVELAAWVDRLVTVEALTLPDDWPDTPAIHDRLKALHQAHVHAVSTKAGPTEPVIWYTNHLPGILREIEAVLARHAARFARTAVDDRFDQIVSGRTPATPTSPATP